MVVPRCTGSLRLGGVWRGRLRRTSNSNTPCKRRRRNPHSQERFTRFEDRYQNSRRIRNAEGTTPPRHQANLDAGECQRAGVRQRAGALHCVLCLLAPLAIGNRERSLSARCTHPNSSVCPPSPTSTFRPFALPYSFSHGPSTLPCVPRRVVLR